MKDLKIDEFGYGPQLPDGMNLCAGCEDVFTLGKYCAFCQAVHDELADRYGDAQKATRIQMGTVPFDALEPQAVPSNRAVCVILGGTAVAAMFTLTGMWYAGRGLIGYCLEKGW